MWARAVTGRDKFDWLQAPANPDQDHLLEVLAVSPVRLEFSSCPLWVKSGHPAPWPFMSAIGGKADIGEGLMRNRHLNVRFRGLSGRSRAARCMSAYSHKRTFGIPLPASEQFP